MPKELTLKQRRRVATAYAKAHYAGKPYLIKAGVAFEDGTFRKSLADKPAELIGQGFPVNKRKAVAEYARHLRRMK